jgi:phage replication-related protein YjqB (UPF0714/DUF867 family)
MVVRDVTIRIRRAPAGSELTDHPEHCSCDGRLLAELGRTGHPQVRIRHGDELALYTVSAVVDEDESDVVRMGKTGRVRLDGADAFGAIVDPVVTRSELSDEDAAAQGEFVERLDDDGHQRDLIVLAPHGGDIERHTDDQAELVAAHTARSSWRGKGWRPDGGALERWHITSTDIDIASFPLLRSLGRRRFRHAVAFHGFGGSGVVIGGRAADDIKHAVCRAIDDALLGTGIDVRIAGPDDPLGGDDAANIVNRLTIGRRGGIQIEQDEVVRTDHWSEVAQAVSDVYANLLSRRPVSR